MSAINTQLDTPSSGSFATSRRGGIDAYEMAFIQQKAAEGVSAFNIARMVGRPEATVRPWMLAPEPEPREAPRLTRKRVVLLSLWEGETPVPVCAKSKATLVGIAKDVAARHGLTLADLSGPSRKKPLVEARQEAMYLLVEQKRWSLPQIGAFLGKRDHTSVLHGHRTHQARLTGTPSPALQRKRDRDKAFQAALKAKVA